MKARVTVSLKKTVLDPQGQTIRGALTGRGHKGIVDIRVGKVFEVQVADGPGRDEIKKELEEIARSILANPVIEDYSVELEAEKA